METYIWLHHSLLRATHGGRLPPGGVSLRRAAPIGPHPSPLHPQRFPGPSPELTRGGGGGDGLPQESANRPTPPHPIPQTPHQALSWPMPVESVPAAATHSTATRIFLNLHTHRQRVACPLLICTLERGLPTHQAIPLGCTGSQLRSPKRLDWLMGSRFPAAVTCCCIGALGRVECYRELITAAPPRPSNTRGLCPTNRWMWPGGRACD